MSTRTYPYKAWTLQPSYKPVEVEIVKPSYPHSAIYADWDDTQSGKSYHVHMLHPTKEAAIAFGRSEIERQRKALAERHEKLDKKVAALDKAAQS